MLARLVSHSDRTRFRHVVISMMTLGPVADRIAAQEVPVHSLAMTRGLPSPAAAARLMRILRAESPDVLQTWLYGADLFGLMASVLRPTIALAWNVRCSDMGRQRRRSLWTRWACARMSACPRVVVVNSEAGRTFHVGLGYRPQEWKVLPNGIDVEEFKPDPQARPSLRAELRLPSDAILIGLVARVDPLKDHSTFIQAAGRLAPTVPQAHFVLVGLGCTPDNPSIVSQIESASLSGRVHLLGRRTEIARIVAAFDIACLSSVSEGFPNVVAEAMACGVPCVVTDVGDARRIVGDTGVVVPAGDAVALAGGFQQLLALGARQRGHLGRAARERIRTQYSLARAVREYEELYNTLASGRSTVVGTAAACS